MKRPALCNWIDRTSGPVGRRQIRAAHQGAGKTSKNTLGATISVGLGVPDATTLACAREGEPVLSPAISLSYAAVGRHLHRRHGRRGFQGGVTPLPAHARVARLDHLEV